MDLNKVMVIGRLTRDPELRNLTSGQSVTSFGVATNHVWVDANKQKQEKVEFHNMVAWGKLAEIISQYLRKGRRAYFEGRLQTREWTGQDGIKRRTTEIVIENMIMLDGPRGENLSNSPAPIKNISRQEEVPQEVIEEEVKVEDIPF